MSKSLKHLVLNSEDYDIILESLITLQKNGFPNWGRLSDLIAYFKFICADCNKAEHLKRNKSMT